jgi:hypothetical protein
MTKAKKAAFWLAAAIGSGAGIVAPVHADWTDICLPGGYCSGGGGGDRCPIPPRCHDVEYICGTGEYSYIMCTMTVCDGW